MLRRIAHLVIFTLLFALLTTTLNVLPTGAAQIDDFDLELARELAAQRGQPGYLFDYREAGRTVDSEGGGGVVYVRLYNRADGQLVRGVIDLIILTRDDGRWNIYMPGDEGYVDALARLPKVVREGIDPSPYRIQPDPQIDAILPLDDYRFPWGPGRWATVTRSYADHGAGEIDFDITNRAVTAAKDGTVIYVNDLNVVPAYAAGAWWYWNTVVIKHGDYQYSLYGHLRPHTIPTAITSQCSGNLSRPNCNVPIKAGDVIGAEGTSGYASDYHLHVQFGQGFGIVAYPDLLDGDYDGKKDERVYASYVYQEHNVGFQGYTPDEIAALPWGTLLQAPAHPTAPSDVDLVRNGDFAAGTADWSPSGQINWQVRDGAMQFLRLKTDADPKWAVFYQDLGYSALAHQPFEVSLKLGNISGIDKSVTVTLRNSEARDYGALSCTFSIPHGAPLATYTMRGEAAQPWGTIRLEIGVNPADSATAAVTDDIVARVLPQLAAPGCSGPEGG